MTPDWLRVISEVALVVFVPVLLWNARTMIAFRDEIRSIRQALFGMNGDNGLASEIKGLREDRHRHATRLTQHAFQIAEIARAANVRFAVEDREDTGP